MKRVSLLLMIASGILAMAGYAKNAIPGSTGEHFTGRGLLPHFERTLFDIHVACLGGLCPNDEIWVSARLNNGFFFASSDMGIRRRMSQQYHRQFRH